MFQNIGVIQKISDFDISETCGEEISRYIKKYIFYSRIHRRQLSGCDGNAPAVFF
jgi:hypothetical protein